MEPFYLFIINPNSGKRNSEEIIASIKSTLPSSTRYEIELWRTIEEFNSISVKLRSGQFTHAVAVGGDGSVNLVAKTILNTTLMLGIIPAGSGNGLARSLGIKMEVKAAILQLLDNKTAAIDVGLVNGIPFFCTSGVGFDAHIGKLFANLKTRGLKTYIKLVVKEFFSYQPETYNLEINGNLIQRKAFFITVANAGQFGNDFYIAPKAKLNDGVFHVVVAKPIPLLFGIGTLIKIIARKADTSRYLETYTCNELKISRTQKGAIHYDGEPNDQTEELIYKLLPGALKVVHGAEAPCL